MSKIESHWTTEAGLKAVVLMTELGHRAGYVAVPPGHKLHGKTYSDSHPDYTLPATEEVGKRGPIELLIHSVSELPRLAIVFDVHGSLTYAGPGGEYPVTGSDELWWFGFDAGHSNDKPDLSCIENPKVRASMQIFENLFDSIDGARTIRTLEYMREECESLARQLVTRGYPLRLVHDQ